MSSIPSSAPSPSTTPLSPVTKDVNNKITVIADEDLRVETFYSKDLMLLLLNKLHISSQSRQINPITSSVYIYTYVHIYVERSIRILCPCQNAFIEYTLFMIII